VHLGRQDRGLELVGVGTAHHDHGLVDHRVDDPSHALLEHRRSLVRQQ
jgi:hypothetical protein